MPVGHWIQPAETLDLASGAEAMVVFSIWGIYPYHIAPCLGNHGTMAGSFIHAVSELGGMKKCGSSWVLAPAYPWT